MRLFSLICFLLVFVTVDQAQAQQARRGRFFQKIRNELFSSSKNSDSDKEKEAKEGKTQARTPSADANNRKPVNSQRSLAPVPTQPSRGIQNRQPSLANTKDYYRPSPTNGYSRSSAKKQPQSSSVFTAKSTSPIRSRQTKSSNPSKGFGFSVRMDGDDQLVVSTVERDGNAASEGLRRGDVVLEIGGIEATSLEEFDEISNVMSDGDQMEFKIKRSGREQKLDILFGDSPTSEIPAGEVKENRASNSQPRRYDFAPPAASAPKQTNSVLTSQPPIANSKSRPASYSNDSAATRQIRYLNQTIEKQNLQIQYLQQQIKHLQRSNRSR